jgi:hypothetical protein
LFNWFINAGPTASGTLFLLTQEYLGTPAGLSAATPGFVASTATISAGVWSFAPGVTVQSNTQYFFYSNQALQISGGLNLYAGGILYWTVGSPTFVGQNTDDFDFLLQGTPTAAAVPEPGTFVLLGLGIVGAAARRRMQAPIARLPL